MLRRFTACQILCPFRIFVAMLACSFCALCASAVRFFLARANHFVVHPRHHFRPAPDAELAVGALELGLHSPAADSERERTGIPWSRKLAQNCPSNRNRSSGRQSPRSRNPALADQPTPSIDAHCRKPPATAEIQSRRANRKATCLSMDLPFAELTVHHVGAVTCRNVKEHECLAVFD